MKLPVQRICVQAKPHASHPKFFEWQTATICILVPTRDRALALERAREELSRRRWALLTFDSKSTLVESRVREAGGELWEAYRRAASSREIIFKIFPHHFGAGDKRERSLSPARLTEGFIDRVVAEAGGRRLTPEEIGTGQRNADYLLGDYIFELKDLQEDVLAKSKHQRKVAALFAPYFRGQPEAVIDPSILKPDDLRTYLTIIGTPLHSHVRSASKQIKATRVLLARPDLKGGIIVLNTGCSSYPHELFGEQVERYVRKDSRQLDVAIAVSCWFETNGWDSYVFYRIWPEASPVSEMAAFTDAFARAFEQMMTDLLRGNLPRRHPRPIPPSPWLSRPRDSTSDGSRLVSRSHGTTTMRDNSTFDRTAGSHSLAAAGQRDR